MTKNKAGKTETTEEYLARKAKDPEWVRRQAQEKERQERVHAESKAIQKPLREDLAAVGWPVESVYDLVNTSKSYPEAIPVLLRHMKRDYPERIREGIARALTVKEARGAPAREILEELKRAGPDEIEGGFRWCLANALTVAGDSSLVREIDALLNDDRFKDTHAILKLARKNSAKVKL